MIRLFHRTIDTQLPNSRENGAQVQLLDRSANPQGASADPRGPVPESDDARGVVGVAGEAAAGVVVAQVGESSEQPWPIFPQIPGK